MQVLGMMSGSSLDGLDIGIFSFKVKKKLLGSLGI